MPPQITCPHCGSTINLENRKEVDFEKIMYALNSSPKSFTELLEITNLPRKTLSIRLKDLCNSGSIVKDGGYRLGTSFQPNKRMYTTKRDGNGKMNSTILHIGKNAQWIPAALIVCLAVVAFGSAIMLTPPSPHTPLITPNIPTVPTTTTTTMIYVDSLSDQYQVGDTINLKIMISDVTDLFAWQAGMTFNPAVLQCVTEPAPANAPPNATATTAFVEGPFLKQNGGFTLWFPGTVENGVILAHGDTLTIPAAPVSGSGVLATVTFKVIAQGSFGITLTNVMLIGPDGTTQLPVLVAN